MGRSAEELGIRNGTDQYQGTSAPLTIDTYYLTLLLEYGVIGFLTYITMLSACIYSAFRFTIYSFDVETEYLFPLGIAMTNFLIIKSIFSQQENHPKAFMYMGIIAALIFRLKSRDR